MKQSENTLFNPLYSHKFPYIPLFVPLLPLWLQGAFYCPIFASSNGGCSPTRRPPMSDPESKGKSGLGK